MIGMFYEKRCNSVKNNILSGVFMKKTFDEKLQSVLRYPEMIEAISDVIDFGIRKGYEDENWLKKDGKRMSRKENFDSIGHHLALHFSGKSWDEESNLRHLAHAITRCGMELTRLERDIIHTDDESKRLQHLRATAWKYNKDKDEDASDWNKIDDSKCLTIDEALAKYKDSPYTIDIEETRNREINRGNK